MIAFSGCGEASQSNRQWCVGDNKLDCQWLTGGSNAGYTQRNGSFTDQNGQLIPFVTSIDGQIRHVAAE